MYTSIIHCFHEPYKIPFNSTLYFELFTVGNVSLDFSVNIEIGKFDCHKFRNEILCKVSYLHKIMLYSTSITSILSGAFWFGSTFSIFSNFSVHVCVCVYGNWKLTKRVLVFGVYKFLCFLIREWFSAQRRRRYNNYTNWAYDGWWQVKSNQWIY